MPERRPGHLLKMEPRAGRPKRLDGLGAGQRHRRGGVGHHLEPAGLQRRAQRVGVEHRAVQRLRQRRTDRVARDLHRLAGGRHRAQLIRGLDAVGLVDLGGDADAQKLGLEGFAAQHRLPQHQLAHGGCVAQQRLGQDGAQPDRQQGAAALAVLVEPGHAAAQIVQPTGPGGIGKLTRAVTGAKGVDHQRAHAGQGQRPRLHRHHGPATVHFFGKRRHHQHIAQRRAAGGRRKVQRTQRPAGAGQQQRLRRHRVRRRHRPARAGRVTPRLVWPETPGSPAPSSAHQNPQPRQTPQTPARWP